MNKKYLKIVNLSVSENLAKFINKELLPGTKIKKEKFWKGFDKYAHELAFKNKKLILQNNPKSIHFESFKNNNIFCYSHYSDLGSNTSLSTSPNILSPKTVRATAVPGTRAVQGARSR